MYTYRERERDRYRERERSYKLIMRGPLNRGPLKVPLRGGGHGRGHLLLVTTIII